MLGVVPSSRARNAAPIWTALALSRLGQALLPSLDVIVNVGEKLKSRAGLVDHGGGGRAAAQQGRLSVVVAVVAAPFAMLAALVVGAPVARHAIVEVADPFLLVFGPDLGRGVFVAAEAGVARELVAGVAGCTRGVVIAVEQEVPVVVERRWLPARGNVALRTGSGHLLVEAVCRGGMAALTSRQRGARERGVVEGGR
ncbi:MAG: hypothetical protein KA297_22205 [Kofleriaceae bacterium]|nr:hypothetical protein [Kofleriaceae bacterium]